MTIHEVLNSVPSTGFSTIEETISFLNTIKGVFKEAKNSNGDVEYLYLSPNAYSRDINLPLLIEVIISHIEHLEEFDDGLLVTKTNDKYQAFYYDTIRGGSNEGFQYIRWYDKLLIPSYWDLPKAKAIVKDFLIKKQKTFEKPKTVSPDRRSTVSF